MFKLTQWIHKPKFEAAKDAGPDFEKVHEEMNHNMCELTDKYDITWSAPLNY